MGIELEENAVSNFRGNEDLTKLLTFSRKFRVQIFVKISLVFIVKKQPLFAKILFSLARHMKTTH